MKYATAAGFRAALLERLRADAERAGVSPEQLRKRVVFERLLARLVMVAPDRWTLKGAVGLALRLHGRIRTTRDLDLLGPHTVDLATEDLIAAQELQLDDHFRFAISRSSEPPRPRGSVRFHVTTEIGGVRFDEAVVDVEGRDDGDDTPEMIESHLLVFADVPAVTIPVIPLELQIADKVHAYTRPHGRDQTEASTRPKDLADLYSVSRNSASTRRGSGMHSRASSASAAHMRSRRRFRHRRPIGRFRSAGTPRRWRSRSVWTAPMQRWRRFWRQSSTEPQRDSGTRAVAFGKTNSTQ